MRDLVLTGFMGTGKTTVGRILADRTGLEFVDLDAEIERRAGSTIAEFWARHAEPAFRDIEAQTFAEIMNGRRRGASDRPARIVATGAGTLTFERNRAHLQSDDVVVSLTCEVAALCGRLDRTRAARPLLSRLADEDVAAYVEDHLARRRPVYDLYRQVDTTRLAPEQVAAEIERLADLATFTLTFDPARVSTIAFGRGLSRRLGTVLAQHGTTGSIMAVTDETVYALPRIRAAINALSGPDLEAVGTTILPAGEQHKTLSSVQQIYRAAMNAGLDRSSTLAGLGGGVIGDIAGHAAATYMRGNRLVLVPTTLLAQVDAAIGGKVGADFEGVKNLIGAFHPARVIVIDPDLLETLPDAALADGLAEIVKTAMVFSVDLLEKVEALRGAREILSATAIIRQTAAVKVQVVEADPYERGVRGLLNFGHTIGHGIEAGSGYKMSHGQAISAGMVAETWLAVRLGMTDRSARTQLCDLLRRFTLPLRAASVDADAVWTAIQSDKKRLRGALRFGLPTAPGRGEMIEVAPEDARAAVDFACGSGGEL
jgi:3-dehydroquinate synthase